MEKNNNKWSNMDDIALEILIGKNFDLYDISLILEKTLFAVQNRVFSKNLYNVKKST